MAFQVSVVVDIKWDDHTRETSFDFVFDREDSPTRADILNEVSGAVADSVEIPAAGPYPAPGVDYTFSWEVQSVFQI